MKIVEYWDAEIPGDVFDLGYDLAEKIAPRLAEMYPTSDGEGEFHAMNALDTHLGPIMHYIGGSVEGKTILDLGCGSNNPQLEGSGVMNDSMYEPWLCRALLLLGADPIGVDIGSLERERFRHILANLNDPDALGSVPDGSVDLAHAKQLFDSSYLRERLGIRPEKLKARLYPQLERVLKPESYFLIWETKVE